MSAYSPATPFGQRPASLGLMATAVRLDRARDAARQPGASGPVAVNKWTVFRALAAAARPLGLSDRSLSVLNALLSFHPETALSLPPMAAAQVLDETAPDPACDLVVFPSNKALAARAHGMAEKTLRRHLAALVEAGLIVRRDSPNGKRYARRAAEGREAGFADAFGFDLTPLVVRAAEFEALAAAEKRRITAMARLREMISLLRRDVMKTIALGLDEGLPGPWEDYRLALLPLLTPLRRIGEDLPRLEATQAALQSLRTEVANTLSEAMTRTEMTGSDGFDDRHYSNSNTEGVHESEPADEERRGEATGLPDPEGDKLSANDKALPLALVLEACPDVLVFAPGGRVETWRSFAETARLIRSMLGISPDAFAAASEVLGETDALIAVASILQRSEYSSEAVVTGAGVVVNASPAIRSPGGYLRALTDKARAGGFALGPMLMALIGQRLKSQRAGRVV